MKFWLRHHLRSLASSWARLAATPYASALNVLAIAVTLALPLGAYALIANVQRVAYSSASADPQMGVFFALDATRADIDRVSAVLKNSAAVRASHFVAKDEALARMRRDDGMSEVIDALAANPLPDALFVDLKADHSTAAAALAEQLKSLPKVDRLQLDALWLQRLGVLLRIGTLAVMLLAALLAVGLVAVIFNTVRGQILSQRDEIEISKLIGATDAYIRRPFYYQGAALGLCGALLATGLVIGAGRLLNPEIGALASSYGSSFRLELPPVADLAALAIFAMFLGIAGAWLSVSRHLATIRPR